MRITAHPYRDFAALSYLYRRIAILGTRAAVIPRNTRCTSARPVLDQLCRRVDLLGPSGTGSAMKLAINLPLAVYWEALGEALSLVRDAGIPPEKMLEILADSSGATNVLKNRAPKLAAALKDRPKPEVGFDIDGRRKDLRAMLAVGSSMGLDLPVTAKTLDCYESAAQAGWGSRDASNLVVHRLEKPRKR